MPVKPSLGAASLPRAYRRPHTEVQCTASESIFRCSDIALLLQADRHRYMKVKGVSADKSLVRC